MQDEPTTKVIGENTWFIPESRLGLIEQATKQAVNATTKRKRQVDFNNVEQVLKRLGLVPKSVKIIGLSFGLLDFGERGLFIITAVPTTLDSQLPTEAA